MLNWITGKAKKETTDRSDHPLGSDAAIQEFLSGLPSGRPESVLLELSDWLTEPARLSAGLPADAVIRAVLQLDAFAEQFLDKTWSGFLADRRVDHLGEQKLKALDTFYEGRHASCRLCLQLLDKLQGSSQSTTQSLCGLLAQRAINGLVGRLRIQRIRYRSPDSNWWQAIGEIIALAQNYGAINLKQLSYPQDATQSSPWLELLIALFFEVSPLGNCTPQQMDLLLRILRWLEPNFMVQDSYSAQSPYFIRLDKLAPPAKSIGSLAADPNLVFIGPGMAYGRLLTLRTVIKKEGQPEWLTASHCTDEHALAIVDALAMHWSERPPQRRHQRERTDAVLRTANGFSNIRRVIAYSEFARSGRKVGYKTHLEMLKFERRGFADTVQESEADQERWQNATPIETLEALETAGDKQMMDDWSVVDVSETGIGASAAFLKPWMVVGAYVGFRMQGELDWQVAILRRIHRTASGHPSLGLETFAETPRCAQVQRVKPTNTNDPWRHLDRDSSGQPFEDAIVLSMAKSLLLLPAGVFNAGAVVMLQVGGSRFAVQLKSVTHSNADCDCVKYELCEGGIPKAT